MTTTLAQELASGRTLRCRYTLKSGDRCTGEAVMPPDRDPVDKGTVLLCPVHLLRAYEAMRVILKTRNEALR